MQNKGYSHPFGSTLFPGAPPVVQGNGVAPGQGPAGAPSGIPGTLGVAGPRARVAEHFKVAGSNRCICGQWWDDESHAQIARDASAPLVQQPSPHPGLDALITQLGAIQPSSKPTTAADAMMTGMVDGLVNFLADKLAGPIADRVVAAVMQKLEEIGAHAQRAIEQQAAPTAAQPTTADVESERAARRAEYDRVHAELAGSQMVAGGASGVHAMVTKQVANTAGSALGIDGEQVEAYKAAHQMLMQRVRCLDDGDDTAPFVRVLRAAPEPPVFELEAKNGATSTWTAYSTSYDSPRFPLNLAPGACGFVLVRDGQRLGLSSEDGVLAQMHIWLENPPEVQALSPVDVSSAGINVID